MSIKELLKQVTVTLSAGESSGKIPAGNGGEAFASEMADAGAFQKDMPIDNFEVVPKFQKTKKMLHDEGYSGDK